MMLLKYVASGVSLERLLDNPGNQIEAVLDGRGTTLETLALVGFGDFVGTQTLGGVQRVGQWRDALGVDGLQAIRHLQDSAQVVHVTFGFIVVQAQASKVGGTPHVFLFKRHSVNFL